MTKDQQVAAAIADITARDWVLKTDVITFPMSGKRLYTAMVQDLPSNEFDALARMKKSRAHPCLGLVITVLRDDQGDAIVAAHRAAVAASEIADQRIEETTASESVTEWLRTVPVVER